MSFPTPDLPRARAVDSPNTAAVVLMVVCAALAARIYFFLGVALPLNHDGVAYLGAARAVVKGQSPIGDVGAHVYHRTHPIPPYIYPPTLAVLLAPIARASSSAAEVVWLVAVATSCAGLAFLLSRWLGLLPAVLATIGFVPVWDTFVLGQVNAIIAVLLALSIAAAEDRHWRRLGAYLAAGALLKLTPVVGLAVLLARRCTPALLTAGAIVFGVVAASLPFVSLEDWRSGASIAAMQELDSPYLMSWPSVLSRATGIPAGRLSIVLGLGLLAFTLVHARSLPISISLAAASLVPLLAAVVVWPHHAAMALPAIAVVWRRDMATAAAAVPLVVWLALNFLTFTPVVMPATITALWILLLCPPSSAAALR